MSKIRYFKGLTWFSYASSPANWHVIKAEQAMEIVALNKQGKKIAQLEDYVFETTTTNPEQNFQNVVGQDSLTRFDQPKKKSKNKKRRKPSKDKMNKTVFKAAF